MGHEITQTDRTLSVRQMPWMGLLDGQVNVLPEYPTRAEAQALVHPWEPVETEVYRQVPRIEADGTLSTEYLPIDGTKAIERSDNGATLGVVNETLGLITNTEMWDVAEAVGTIGDESMIETAGSLEGGSKVWILLRLVEPLHIKGDPNGDSLAYLAFQNSHNGGGSFRAQSINTRIVCANTSSAADTEAKRNGYEFTFRHTSGVKGRIEEAKAAVSMWREGVVVWTEAMEHLLTIPVTPAQREVFIEQFQPMPNQRLISERVRTNVETARAELRTILNSATCEGVDLTAYGLAQAGVEWSQHVRRTRGNDERSRMESRFKRAMLSTDRLGADIIRLAQDVAVHA